MAKLYEPTSEIALDSNQQLYDETLQANEMNPVAAVVNSLLNLGVAGVAGVKEKKYVRAANTIILAGFVFTLIYLVVAIYWENWRWVSALTLAELIGLAALALNANNRTYFGRFVFAAGINFTIFSSALFVGPVAHIEHFLVLAAVLPFLVFNSNKLAYIVPLVMLPLALLMLYAPVQLNFAPYQADEVTQMQIQRLGFFVQIAVLLTMVLQFVKNIRTAEEELEVSKAQMMMQTTELKRSNSDLEQFAYIISHDLKAPVRNISSFMNLLLVKHSPQMNDEAREFVNYSHLGAKRLERLIDDVLAYCRIGTNLPSPVPVNLNDVVNTIRFELRDKVNRANGVITINKELPVVNHVHASLMYHVFQNLISNGLKFNKSEQPEISINWTNSLNHYTFSVHDNGIGISKEYSATIFQMFKRLHTEQDYDGTGIGLAICKKIVDYYHGEIWFESEAGKGTTFFFTIRKF